jgi:2-amino-4-hydroxy-6-hydroxymethyldihydropteridine diphosphokinase
VKTLRAGIALGTNIEPRFESLLGAVAFLKSVHAGGLFLVSPVYETEPVDCPPPAAAFLNAAAEISTVLEPLDLLDALQAHERKAGRPDRRPKNSPRPIDLDLLYVGDRTFWHPRLVLPHPMASQRPFVLVPLADIVPEHVLPGTHHPVSQLAATCNRTGISRRTDLNWK